MQPNVNVTTSDAGVIGQPHTVSAQHKAKWANSIFKEELSAIHANIDGTNARQSFMMLKQSHEDPHMPMPDKCDQPAPDSINVFTDGSWKFPLKYFLGLGGAETWWPQRQLSEHPLSTPEIELAFHTEHTAGVRLFTRIGGFSGSSTRTELAAGIVAVSAHGPVHIASDSRVFVDSANHLLSLLKRGRECKVKWKLVSDGDLWQHFVKAVEAKGPHSVRATWVKGHASDAHVAKGITTQANKEGNDIADSTADLGVELYGGNVLKVAKLLYARHQKYQAFMIDLSKHIVEAYFIHRELIRISEAKLQLSLKHVDKSAGYTHLQYAASAQAKHLAFTSTINRYGKLIRCTPNLINIEITLRALNVVPSTADCLSSGPHMARALCALPPNGQTQTHRGRPH